MFRAMSLFAVLLLSQPAQSATLMPGQSVFVPGTDAVETPALAGAELKNDSHPLIFDPNYFVNGDLASAARYDYRDQVVRSDQTGAMIFGPLLEFTYNLTAGMLFIDSFTLTGYAGYAVDVVNRTDAGGDRSVTSAARSADGDQITFTFGFPLVADNLFGGPAQDSFPISILTDARGYSNEGRATFRARSTAYPGEILEISIGGLAIPAPAPVPLPAPALLLLAGLAALAGLRRRGVRKA